MQSNMFIIGLMSGTSLDGLDIALCRFSTPASAASAAPDYEIVAAETIAYPEEWLLRLSTLEHASAIDYALADVELGHYFGRCVCSFLERHPSPVDYIASHGHTIFHQPSKSLTAQIGDIDAIAAETGLSVIGRFRNLDVALGGQGAPLVPIGDQLLFSRFDACLNLGGFSNISFRRDGRRIAFDVSPCNMALNYLALLAGEAFDRDGNLAKSGRVDADLLGRLQSLSYYAQPAPKSLGKEWFVSEFLPLISQLHLSVEDRLATVSEHVALQVAEVLKKHSVSSLVITGGGAKNGYLISLIKDLAPHTQIHVPDALLVDYKEALIFALLGYLRATGQVNTLRSVTGARVDSIGGCMSGIVPLK